MNTNPDISIIIPAKDEEKRLPATIKTLKEWKKKSDKIIEIIIVTQGTDKTHVIAAEASHQDPSIQYITQNSLGKGNAVRTGILKGHGNILLFTDTDLSVPLECIDTLIEKLQNNKNIDGIIGNRRLPQSEILIKQPLKRRIASKIFNLAIRTLRLTTSKDTQCGCKLFKRKAAKEIFSQSSIAGFAFDLEILLLAKKLGYKLQEEPVTWKNDTRSQINLSKDALKTLKEIWLIKQIWVKNYEKTAR